MRRTSPVTLVVLAVVGALLGFGVDQLLTAAARPTFTPSAMLAIVLFALAACVLLFAWPVRRSARGGKRVDPFRALRVATLARASSLVGALVGGFTAGLIVFLLTRPVPAQVGSMVAMITVLAGAVVLVAAAVVAELFCTLPKDSDDREPGDPNAG